MDWADELAASVSGPQVVNDTRRRRGRSMSGSLRGPVILDVITRALRARGHRDDAPLRHRRPGPDGRPGAPDARRRRSRDGPAARPRPGPGRRRARLVRPPPRPGRSSTSSPGLGIHPGPLLLDERHLPDRGRWIRTSGPPSTGPPTSARSIAGSPTSSTPTTGTRSRSSARPAARSARRSSPSGTASASSSSAASTLVDVGARLRHVGLDLAVRRHGEAALEPRVGRPVVAVRRDDRAVRQGSLDRRRIARPGRRDRPRGLRARAAAQRPVRVPEHRRQEDVDLEGPRRGGPRDRRRRPARAAPLPVHPAAPEPGDRVRPGGTDAIPRLFDEFDKFAAATAGREVRGEMPPGLRGDVPRTRCSTRTRTSPPRPPRSGRRSRTSRSSPRSRTSTSPARVEAEKGSALTEREDARSSTSAARGRARLARDLRARAGGRRGPARRVPAEAVARLDDEQRALPRRARRRRSRRTTRPRRGEAWQDLIFRSPRDGRPAERPGVRRALRGVPRPAERARARAGCWHRSTRRSSTDRLRERRGTRDARWPA